MTINHQWRRATVLAAVVPVLALSVAEVPSAASADTSSPVALPSPNSSNLLTEGATTTPLDFTQQVALRAQPLSLSPSPCPRCPLQRAPIGSRSQSLT
jgi:hypothetical protein